MKNLKLFFSGSLVAVAGAALTLGMSAAMAHPGNAPACLGGEKDSFRCHARVVLDGKGDPGVTTVPAGYGPGQFHTAYNLPTSTAASAGKVIAVVDAYDQPNIQSDLNSYSAKYGIPALPACSGPIASSPTPCFQKVNQNGGNSYPKFNSGWGLEISLDVETAHGICQNCSILLVEANSASYGDLLAAVDKAVALGANVVSNSYGSNEFSGETSYDAHFNHQGVAVTFSSGDSGYGTEYPAASKYVTAVGGTTLTLGANNSYGSESAWSGSGSGCSVYESKPSWQKDTGCSNSVGPTRTVADVSADADPNTGAAVLDSCYQFRGSRCAGGWYQVGGTSLSSPLIAGVYALGGLPAGVQENSLPYGAAANLHDVISGSNGSCGTYLCNAVSSYDGPTGLGTPLGAGAF